MPLPTVDFFGHRVSKLILGGNPISGNSHFSHDRDTEMVDYFNAENTKRLFFECERHGITAMQLRGDRHVLRLLHEYRGEGGNLMWIAQSVSEFADIRASARTMTAYKPIAIYLHGTRADNYWKTGKITRLKDDLAALRESGVPVGLGTHTPEVIEDSESRGWDVDFYMAGLYNPYKLTPGWRESFLVSGKHEPEVYEHGDRERMSRVVRQVKKPCLVFKILAAGRNAEDPARLRESFQFALNNIKPCDAVVVGMFPKRKNQIAENAALVAEIHGTQPAASGASAPQ